MADLSVLNAARHEGDRDALVARGRTYTFAALAEQVQRVIGWLERRGLRGSSDQRVAVVAYPNVETLIVLYALVERGIPLVPLHPRLTPPERKQLLDDSQPCLVIEDAAAQFGEMQRVSSPESRPAPPDDDRCLAVVYTSGTTGRPKGAVLSRRALVAAARASESNLGWRRDDRWLLCMPTAHVGGLSIVLRCLLARQTMVLATADIKGRFDPIAIHAEIEHERVSLASLVPTMLHQLVQAKPDWRPRFMRAILLGGAPASPKLIATAAERALPVLTTYGLTEACSQVTTQRFGTLPSAEQGAGEPLPGVEVQVVDEQILVRGQAMMSGYLSVTTQPAPFLAGGWFPTGDLGYFDDRGHLHLLCRRLDLIVSGGENVYPAEVERHLQEIAGVKDAGVFGVPDEVWGQTVCAAIVRDSGGQLGLADLARHLSTTIAAHKRPRRVAFVTELPLTETGKLDRRRLVEFAGPHLTSVTK